MLPEPEDVRFLVRAAVQSKTDPELRRGGRARSTLAELEEMARDLATQLHVAAQKKDDKALYLRGRGGLRGVPARSSAPSSTCDP